jgi:hypothetical protein
VPVQAKILDDAEKERLQKVLEKIERAEQDFAVTVRRLGIAAYAREMGLTPEAVRKRVLKVLGPPK